MKIKNSTIFAPVGSSLSSADKRTGTSRNTLKRLYLAPTELISKHLSKVHFNNSFNLGGKAQNKRK